MAAALLQALRRPVEPPLLIAGAGGIVGAVALYCVGYTWLAGRPESFSEALGWAGANVLPWLFGIEAAKRSASSRGAIAWLLGSLLASLALGYLFRVSADGIAFELLRRLPALAVSAAAVALLRSHLGGGGAPADMPLLPRQIDWVKAAGNYIELRSGGRTVVQRASISSVERELRRHGFVRIHRSTLVRRDRIARVRPQDVVLHDGTHLKLGRRYRAHLDD